MKKYKLKDREYILLDNIRSLNFNTTQEAVSVYRDNCQELFSIEEFLKGMLGYDNELNFFIGPDQWGPVGQQACFVELCILADSVYTVADESIVDYHNYWLNLEMHNFNNKGVSIEEPLFIEIMGYKVMFYYGLELADKGILEPKPTLVLCNTF
jgi:hypothetical protein